MKFPSFNSNPKDKRGMFMSFFIKVEINEVTQNLSAVESIIYSFVKEWIKRYGRPYDQGLLFMQENMPFKTTTRTLINNIKNLEKYSIYTINKNCMCLFQKDSQEVLP